MFATSEVVSVLSLQEVWQRTGSSSQSIEFDIRGLHVTERSTSRSMKLHGIERFAGDFEHR